MTSPRRANNADAAKGDPMNTYSVQDSRGHHEVKADSYRKDSSGAVTFFQGEIVIAGFTYPDKPVATFTGDGVSVQLLVEAGAEDAARSVRQSLQVIPGSTNPMN